MASEQNNSSIEKKLTSKEQAFCEYYTVDWNATQAAIKAGYSPDSAKSIGCENLTKPHIQAYIEECKREVERLAGISRLRNAQHLAAIAYSSIAHMHNTWHELSDFEALTDEQKAAIESIETKTEKRTIRVNDSQDIDIETVHVKLKLYSKTAALDMLNKMFGYNAPEKMKVENTNINIEARKLTPAEIKRIAGTLEDGL